MSSESDIKQDREWPWPFTMPVKRVVIKLGSNLLSSPDGTLDFDRVRIVARQIALLRRRGAQVLVVSSGAVAAGMGATKQTTRPTELPRLQALAAIGQSQLMKAYIDAFAPHGLNVAQALITREDLDDRQRYLNAQYTLETLLTMGAVPVINENDTLATEELSFGDNDMLSAIIAVKISAELLVILTDIDGLFDAHPTKDANAKLIPVVDKVTPQIMSLATGPGSGVGKGGMVTKVEAARHATRFGIPTVIANGRAENIITGVLAGDFRGTLFLAEKKRTSRSKARTHWISARRPRGTVTIDQGARHALVDQHRSLLPVGIISVEGQFARGDVISIAGPHGEELARGLSNFSAEELSLLKGHRAEEAPALLGKTPPCAEAVHRNNLSMRV